MSKVMYEFVPSDVEKLDFLLLFCIVIGSVFIYIFFYKRLKHILIRKQIIIVNIFVIAILIVSSIYFLSFKERQTEEKYIVQRINSRNFQVTSGILNDFSKLQDSIEKFSIDKIMFSRYLPNKQIPNRGCWTDYIIDKKNLIGKNVKMKYIVFPKSVQLPAKLGGKKFDQLCILKFEILKI